jgi:hypothetical protein
MAQDTQASASPGAASSRTVPTVPVQDAKPVSRASIGLSLLILAVLCVYTLGVLRGWIPPDKKIDAVHLAFITLGLAVVLLLLRPRAFEGLKLLEGGGLKLEFERVKERQREQGDQLKFVRLVLPLLLAENERRHLLNLADEKTGDYRGSNAVRAELRRLRSLNLIQMRVDKPIAELVKDNQDFDLTSFARLTPEGEEWVRTIQMMEKARSHGEPQDVS